MPHNRRISGHRRYPPKAHLDSLRCKSLSDPNRSIAAEVRIRIRIGIRIRIRVRVQIHQHNTEGQRTCADIEIPLLSLCRLLYFPVISNNDSMQG